MRSVARLLIQAAFNNDFYGAKGAGYLFKTYLGSNHLKKRDYNKR
jgi:hypothetical protein